MARKKHSGNGEGTVVTVKRGSKTQYRAQLTIGWVNGKQQRKTGTLYATRAEARRDLEELRRQRDQGVDLVSRPQTYATFLTTWIDDTFALDATPKSVANYRWAAKHIIAAFGDQPLAKPTGQQLQAFITRLSKSGKTKHQDGTPCQTGYAPKSIGLIATVLHSALDQAVKWKLIAHNPAAHLTLPKIERSKALALKPAEARAFLDAARGERYELGLRLMLGLGMRRGEVAGLRWDDVDFDTGVLTITGTLTYVKGHGLHYGPPKTESGRRSIKLPAALLASLRWHQTRQEGERKAMGIKWQQDCPYVFVSPVDGGALNSNALYQAFKSVAKRAGLPTSYSPHTLRHSCASFLYAEGASDKTVSAFLGHATTQITRDLYIHLLGGELDDAAERIAELFDGPMADDAERRRKQG